MNILSLCICDYAGLAIRLTDAINKYTPHKARLLAQRPHRFKYPKDIETKNPQVIEKWVNWADLVHGLPIYDLRHLCEIPNKKLIWTHVGTDFRKNHHKFRRATQALKIRELTSASDLLFIKNLTWLPSAVPVDEWLQLKTPHIGKPIVCQTPSGRVGKRTNEILAQIAHKKNIDIHIIEEVSWKKCMLLKAKADIYVGQYSIGYGMGEVEAMAMKIPVITKLKPPNDALLMREVGDLPHYDCPIENLSKGIDTLLSDRALYEEYAERCFKYVKKFYDSPVIAKKFISICEEVLSEEAD